MSLALRTFVAMNLDVVVIAVSRRVRSPVAVAPRRNWSLRTCLRGADVISGFPRGCYLDANLVTVTISEVIARSSLMVRERHRGQRGIEGRGW
jgi:hypothetical protein